jgi:hypothetical protein
MSRGRAASRVLRGRDPVQRWGSLAGAGLMHTLAREGRCVAGPFRNTGGMLSGHVALGPAEDDTPGEEPRAETG